MKVRKAVLKDVDAIISMTRDSVESGAGSGYEPDSDTIRDNFLHAFSHPGSQLILMFEEDGEVVGAIAGVPCHKEMNKNIKGMRMIGWCTKPGCGGLLTVKMLDAYLEEAKNTGATYLVLSSCWASTPEEDKLIDTLYKKRGFEPSERIYLKEI